MAGLHDATCPACGHVFGWAGETTEPPPCPECRHRMFPGDMESDAGELDKFREFLRLRKSGDRRALGAMYDEWMKEDADDKDEPCIPPGPGGQK